MEGAEKGVDAHEVVHVGMGDEEGACRFQDALGQVVDPAAVKEQVPSQGPDIHGEHRIIQQSGEEDRFQVAERKPGAHAHSSLLMGYA
jgi:hypothetical protein